MLERTDCLSLSMFPVKKLFFCILLNRSLIALIERFKFVKNSNLLLWRSLLLDDFELNHTVLLSSFRAEQLTKKNILK